jgi:hypothetical protein
LLEYESKGAVIGHALNDRARLQGSQVPNRDQLLSQLAQAVKMLDPSASPLFDGQPSNSSQPSLPQVNNVESEARAAIRSVRFSLNTFVEDRWSGLVQTRIQMLATIALTGSISYVLLAIAIILKSTTASVVAATVFYMVGTVAGLFAWLYMESTTATSPMTMALLQHV